MGIVPAGGRATRLGPLPCSKEILPVGHEPTPDGARPVPAAHYLLSAMAEAGAGRAYVVVGHGKWDIPAYLGDGRQWGLPLAYLTISDSPSTPATVDRAHPFVAGRSVLFGFPDLLVLPRRSLAVVAEARQRSGADVTLGLYRAENPGAVDMVALEQSGRVDRIDIKPDTTDLQLTWLLAAWGPAFTELVHRAVASGMGPVARRGRHAADELFMGDIVQAAIDEGMHVEGVVVPDGSYRDAGSAEGLRRITNPAP